MDIRGALSVVQYRCKKKKDCTECRHHIDESCNPSYCEWIVAFGNKPRDWELGFLPLEFQFDNEKAIKEE